MIKLILFNNCQITPLGYHFITPNLTTLSPSFFFIIRLSKDAPLSLPLPLEICFIDSNGILIYS